MRRLSITLCALACLLATLLVAPVQAQDSDSIAVYVSVSVGQGSSSHITGYVRNSYGAIDPSGFRAGSVSGSVSRMTWDDRRKEMRVALTVLPAHPLTALSTAQESSLSCESGDGRNYTCTDPTDSDPDRPWNVGNEVTVMMTFTPTDTTTAPAPGTAHPTPEPGSESLPVAYGARDEEYGWAMPRVAQDPDGVHVIGSTLYLLDAQDEYVYGFDLKTGQRKVSADFNLDPQNNASASWRGLTFADGRWWVFNSDDYFSFNKDGSGRRGPTDTSTSPQWLHAVDDQTILYALGHAIGRLDVSLMKANNRNPVVPNSQVNFPNSGNDDRGIAISEDRIFAQQTSGIDDRRGNSSVGGVVAYDWQRYQHRDVFVRQRMYDVPTYGSSGVNEPVDYALWISGDHLYTFYLDNGTQDDPSTTDTDERYQVARYAISPSLVFDPSAGFAQRPPTLGRVEPQDERREGDAELVDLKFQWEHTSRVVEGHTVLEFRYRSHVTGESQVATVSASRNEHTITGLPRTNYELVLEMRYRWYNDRESGHELIKNPPGVDDNICASENTDQYPGSPPNGDGIDAREDADTTRPGCAFYLDPNENRYSAWAEIRVPITGPLAGVADASIDMRGYDGLVATAADLLIVAGMESTSAGPMARTLTVIGWLILSSVVGAAVYVATGMQTGSMYLGALMWLIIWAGLGPFVAGIPWAMAYLPVAGLMLAGGTLVLKRGRI